MKNLIKYYLDTKQRYENKHIPFRIFILLDQIINTAVGNKK